jgi:hypothetical protein
MALEKKVGRGLLRSPLRLIIKDFEKINTL